MDATICELNASKVIYEVRHLSVGDFAWIARDPARNELVLPYIVERKRLDDFGSSIRDGRFHEQKFRLMRSGIPNVIYMVEMYDSRHLGLPFKTIMQAATNTNVHNKFTVKITDNHHGSILYLSVMSKMLEKIFEVHYIFDSQIFYTFSKFSTFLGQSPSRLLKGGCQGIQNDR